MIHIAVIMGTTNGMLMSQLYNFFFENLIIIIHQFYLGNIYRLRKSLKNMVEMGLILNPQKDYFIVAKKEIKEEWPGLALNNKPKSLPCERKNK